MSFAVIFVGGARHTGGTAALPSNLQFQAASAGFGKVPQFPQLQTSHNPPNGLQLGRM